jgi:acetyltransferase-like isoleucine patch superfamily enzyme
MTAGQSMFRALRGLVVRPATGWYHRQDAYQQLQHVAACGDGVVVRTPISIGNPAGTSIGDGVAINPGFASKGHGELTIGAFTHFGFNVTILTADHRYEGATEIPYDLERIARPVTIGVACWFGDQVVVAPGTELGDGCVVAAGAVVSGSFEPYSVLAGAPAKVVKTRNADHFEALRAAGRFKDADLHGLMIDGRAMRPAGRGR